MEVTKRWVVEVDDDEATTTGDVTTFFPRFTEAAEMAVGEPTELHVRVIP